jgi:hypothetical protein
MECRGQRGSGIEMYNTKQISNYSNVNCHMYMSAFGSHFGKSARCLEQQYYDYFCVSKD